jgi:hypothetical protein
MITNRQASYLASLQRELGVQFSGAGMTRQEASDAIRACLRRLDHFSAVDANSDWLTPEEVKVVRDAEAKRALRTANPARGGASRSSHTDSAEPERVMR